MTPAHDRARDRSSTATAASVFADATRAPAAADMFASTDVSAVMLTMRRTVADGVRMCTGFATPSRIGPERHAAARRDLEQVERDVRGVERRHDEQVRLALEPRVREHATCRTSSASAASPCISPSTSRSGSIALTSASASRIFVADGCVARAEARMRQQRDLRRDAEAADLLGREQRDLGELLGRRIGIDVGVGDEHGAVGQHQRVHRGVGLHAARAGRSPGRCSAGAARACRTCRTACRRRRPGGSSSRRSACCRRRISILRVLLRDALALASAGSTRSSSRGSGRPARD